MGMIIHRAIVVTGFDNSRYGGPDSVGDAHKKAIELGLGPSPITDPVVNGYQSFLIPPDGSKEGWDHSRRYLELRAAWRDWAQKNAHVYWVEVEYGPDCGEPRVTCAE